MGELKRGCSPIRKPRILGEFSRGARSHGVGYFVSIAVPLLLSSETGLLQGYPLYRGSKFVHRFLEIADVVHFTIHRSNLSRNSCQCCFQVMGKADG